MTTEKRRPGPASPSCPWAWVLLAGTLLSLAVAVESPQGSSVVPPFDGTAFLDPDILTAADPTAFEGLTYSGRGPRTVFDRRVNDWVTIQAYLFDATFRDDLAFEVQVNPEFGSVAAAQAQAERYSRRVGQLPHALRTQVQALWIHRGVQPFGGGNDSILIHTGQGDIYSRDGFLEEILVHEAAHTSLDEEHANAPGWRSAQQADGTFISTYARDHPRREDVAETFSAWLAVRYKADRIPAQMKRTIEQAVPNRLAYFDAQDFNMVPVAPEEEDN